MCPLHKWSAISLVEIGIRSESPVSPALAMYFRKVWGPHI